MNSDYVTFLRELSRSFSQIGAMLPSSPFLGRAMLKPLREYRGQLTRKPIRILEAGPGTGPFTRQILKLMGSSDHLTICEINPRFLERLKLRLEDNPDYVRNRGRVEFFCGAVQNLPLHNNEQRFDLIVSSLPFNNFLPSIVEEILGKYEAILADGGSITFCEYVGVRKLRAILGTSAARKQARGVEEVIQRWLHHVEQVGEVRSEVSLFNVPPAAAIELQYH